MIKLENIWKNYINKKVDNVVALDRVSISFEDKGLVFLVGKSGAGKTTLLNIIGCLDSEYKGNYYFEDHLIDNEKKRNAIRKDKIAFILQENNLIDSLNVYENIFLSINNNNDFKEKKEHIDKLLKEFDLEGYGKRKIKTLSGGEKQRVAIIRAIIKDPKLILMDEPTSSLDKKTSEIIFKFAKGISKEKLVIIVSHDVDLAYKIADRIVSFENGTIEEDKKINYINDSKINLDNLNNKRNNSWKFNLKLIFRFLFNKPIRLTLMILISILSLSFFGLSQSISSFDIANPTIQMITQRDYDSVSLYKTKKMIDNSRYYAPLNNKDLDYLLSNYGITADIVINRDNFTSFYLSAFLIDNDLYNEEKGYENYFYTSNRGVDIGFGLLYKDEDVLKNYYNYEIIGKYPTQKNEILISDYLIKFIDRYGIRLYDENLDIVNIKAGNVTKESVLEKYIYFSKDKIFKIVGVLDSGVDFDNENFKYYDLYTPYVSSEEEENSDEVKYSGRQILYNEYVDEYLKGIPGCLFVSKEDYDELLNTKFSRLIDTFNGKFSFYLDEINNEISYIHYVALLQDSEDIFYFDSQKSSLDINEVIIPFSTFQTYLNRTFDFEDSLGGLQSEDLYDITYFLEFNEGKTNYNIVENQTDYNTSLYFSRILKKDLFEYAKENCPSNNLWFNKFIEEFYKDYNGTINDELRTYAYYEYLNYPYSFCSNYSLEGEIKDYLESFNYPSAGSISNLPMPFNDFSYNDMACDILFKKINKYFADQNFEVSLNYESQNSSKQTTMNIVGISSIGEGSNRTAFVSESFYQNEYKHEEGSYYYALIDMNNSSISGLSRLAHEQFNFLNEYNEYVYTIDTSNIVELTRLNESVEGWASNFVLISNILFAFNILFEIYFLIVMIYGSKKDYGVLITQGYSKKKVSLISFSEVAIISLTNFALSIAGASLAVYCFDLFSKGVYEFSFSIFGLSGNSIFILFLVSVLINFVITLALEFIIFSKKNIMSLINKK